MKARIHRLTGLARSLGWGRSSLRRRTDRIEAAVIAGAVVLVLAAVPAALAIGDGFYHHYRTVSASQTTAERQVTATLLEPAAVLAMGSADSTVAVRARWVEPSGVRHVGVVRATQGARAGSTVRIWTDPAGRQADTPLSVRQPWNRGGFAALATMAIVAGLLGTVIGLIRMRLNRIRYAAWADEWREVGPRWTQRRNSP